MHKKKRHCPASSGGSLTPFPGGGVHYRGHARLRLLAAGASRRWGCSLAPWGTWWPPFLSRGLGGGLATLWGVSPTFRLRGWDFGVIAHPLRSRGTSQPLFYGLIITEVVRFVNLFFKFFRFFFYGRTENLRSPLLIAFRPQGGVGALGTAIGMGLWDEPLRTLAPPAASGEPWAAYL